MDRRLSRSVTPAGFDVALGSIGGGAGAVIAAVNAARVYRWQAFVFG